MIDDCRLLVGGGGGDAFRRGPDKEDQWEELWGRPSRGGEAWVMW